MANLAIDSLLRQSFSDFEILLVDDGADKDTRQVLERQTDGRIRYIRQANDGLSSARNRGLNAARGKYVCFLDADDMRPPWAFEAVHKTIGASDPDCVFARGMLVELRKETLPFYDSALFDLFAKTARNVFHETDSPTEFGKWIDLLPLLEPQSANKFVRREFLISSSIRFPSGHFFEDMLFHTAVISNLNSFAICDAPSFTYFRRYARPQITSSSGTNRFDALSVGEMTLDLFARSKRFHRELSRLGVLLATFKLIQWCETQVSHVHRKHFRDAATYLAQSMDERYLNVAKWEHESVDIREHAHWLPGVLGYVYQLRGGTGPNSLSW